MRFRFVTGHRPNSFVQTFAFLACMYTFGVLYGCGSEKTNRSTSAQPATAGMPLAIASSAGSRPRGAMTEATDANWPQWRGPNRDGLCSETGLLQQWSDGTPELIWQTSNLGDGYSTVAVVDKTLFTLGKRGPNIFTIALNASTGEEKWATDLGQEETIPRSTPTVNADRVYTLTPTGTLACLETSSGNVVWKSSLASDFGGRMMSGWQYSESPLIDGKKLLCTPGGKQATIVALDKQTGGVIWQSSVPNFGSRGKPGAGYSSIVVSTACGIRQYVQLLGNGLVGIAADDGRFLWGYGKVANTTANVPTPVIRDDLVFCSSGYGTGSALVRLVNDGAEGITAEEVYFLPGKTFQNHHGGMVLVGDHIFGGHGNNRGQPTCLDLMTGKVVWRKRGPGSGSAATVYADGHLYFRYQNGVMALIEANPVGYTLKGKFEIPKAARDSWAHPVIAGGRLYLREKDDLYVYDVAAR